MARRASSRGARSNIARTAIALLGGTLLAAACRTTTTVTYVPSPERPRFTLAESGPVLERFLRVECPRPRTDAGMDSVLARVLVDADGEVAEAELQGTSGSSMTDSVIGAIAAQLTFADATPRPDSGSAVVVARYRCGSDHRAEFALSGS